MRAESEMLSRQVNSMRQRLNTLEALAGVDSVAGGGELDKLTLKIEEIDEEVKIGASNR